MQMKHLALTVTAMAVLAACGDKNEPNAAEVCNDPAVKNALSEEVNSILTNDAKAFAHNDARRFIDADKIIAAATGLDYQISDMQPVDGQPNSCQANVSIKISPDTLAVAETNSPLVYGETKLAQIIQQRISDSTVRYQAGVFQATLPYSVQKENGKTRINFTDSTPTVAAQVLSATLLPYGVKDMLVIDGRAVSREAALEVIQNPPIVESSPADALGDFIESLPNESESHSAPELLSPENTQKDEVAFSESEFEQAKQNNRSADQEINRLWKQLDPEIQQTLLSEQRNWIRQKTNSCRQAAASATTTLQAEYLQMQCDTRMTRERVEYLRGYTIN